MTNYSTHSPLGAGIRFSGRLDINKMNLTVDLDHNFLLWRETNCLLVSNPSLVKQWKRVVFVRVRYGFQGILAEPHNHKEDISFSYPFGGEGGTRTPGPDQSRHNGFQDRAVMTTSVPRQICNGLLLVSVLTLFQPGGSGSHLYPTTTNYRAAGGYWIINNGKAYIALVGYHCSVVAFHLPPSYTHIIVYND